MAQQYIKQIRGLTQGSILFLGTNSVVSEDSINLNWNQSGKILYINGNLSVSGGYNLVHNPITELISDIQGYGDIVTFGDTNGLTPGLIYYLNNDGNWSQSTNNSITESKGLLSIALGSNSSDGMLVTGYIKGLSYSLSIGQTIYLGQSGIITNNIPTDVGSVVRVIGYSINNNIIYFNPDNTWIQL
jgi:hypothetical protein